MYLAYPEIKYVLNDVYWMLGAGRMKQQKEEDKRSTMLLADDVDVVRGDILYNIRAARIS